MSSQASTLTVREVPKNITNKAPNKTTNKAPNKTTNYAKTYKKIAAPARRTLSNMVKGFVGIPSHTCIGLHYAIGNGRFEKVKEYIARGADVNCVIQQIYRMGGESFWNGNTPLLMAIKSDNFDIVRLLVASGAVHNKRIRYYGKRYKRITAMPLFSPASDKIRQFLISLPAKTKEAKLVARKSLVDLPPSSDITNRKNVYEPSNVWALRGEFYRNFHSFVLLDGDENLIKRLGAPFDPENTPVYA